MNSFANRIVPALLTLLMLSVGLSLMLGPVTITPMMWLSALHGDGEPTILTILLDIRLPRTLAAAIAGFALGAGGAAMQGLLRNPLADPGVLGISAGAALAATACVYFGFADQWPWLASFAAIGGALAATLILSVGAVRLRGVASLILLGVALSSISGAIMALFVNLAPNPFSLADLINWTAGSVANRDWAAIMANAPLIGIGVAILWFNRSGLALLAIGEEGAHGLGLDLRRHRLCIVVGTGIATGGAVAVAGMVGFIGLIAPHMVRHLVGHDPARTILPSALMGAVLLVTADVIIRLFPWGNELHLGTLAALIGAPAFALIALRAGNIRHG